MPHIHLWTTSDLPENGNVPDILEALVERMSSFETVRSKGVKAYHTLVSVWSMGQDAPPGFAHCEVAILTGRPPELQRSIAEGMYAVLRDAFADSLATGEVGLTLEVREMERETYMQ